MTRPGVLALELAFVGFVLSISLGGSRVGFAAGPTISTDPVNAASPGDRVLVRLEGWPLGTVSIGVCGNNALRGSQDCALIANETLSITSTAPRVIDLTLATPPVPCPCVIRASTPTNDVVATSSMDLRGVPIGQPIEPAGPAAPEQLTTSAHVVSVSEPFPRSWYAPFGGTAKRVLVVTLHNDGDTPVERLRVVSAIGRDGDAGSPVAPRVVRRIAPGETRTLRTPIQLDAPDYGTYVVHGTIYGLASPVRFRASTHNDPWALWLLVPAALAVSAQILRRRERARQRAEAAQEQQSALDAPPARINDASINDAPVTAVISLEELHAESSLNGDREPVSVSSAPSIEEPAPSGATGGSFT